MNISDAEPKPRRPQRHFLLYNLDYVTTHHAGVSEPDAVSCFFLFYTRPGPSSLLQSAVTAGRTQAPINVAKYQKHRTIEWVGL